jgi:hypothetical protein
MRKMIDSPNLSHSGFIIDHLGFIREEELNLKAMKQICSKGERIDPFSTFPCLNLIKCSGPFRQSECSEEFIFAQF